MLQFSEYPAESVLANHSLELGAELNSGFSVALTDWNTDSGEIPSLIGVLMPSPKAMSRFDIIAHFGRKMGTDR